MNIPDEAVEAAAKVLHQDGWEGPPFWESLDMDDPSRLEYLSTARAALEAAAPHLRLMPDLCGTCGGTGLADPEEVDLETECPTCKGSGLHG